MKNLRDSGISALGSITWGTHICCFYSTESDRIKVIAPYIKAGLENNELCIWIYSHYISYEEAEAILRTAIDNIDTYISNNQLKLMPTSNWYLTNNDFNYERVIQQWQELTDYAIMSGFDGLRAVGDTDWVKQGSKVDFNNYEKYINSIICDYKYIGLCLYSIDSVCIAQVADIMNNHSISIILEESNFKIVKNTEILIKEKQLEESQKKLDQLQDYDKLKTDFISNISHELRTPLNVILSTLQMMKLMESKSSMSSDIINKIDKYFNIIQQNCYRQLRLVNNLIDITKIDSDYYKLNLQNFNIIELIENITVSVAEYVQNKGITLIFDTNFEEYYIACDPDRIECIILNLLSNATKFTKNGGKIWVTLFGELDKVTIIIKDTGIGIPQDKLNCIFDRFQQVDNSLARKNEGSGIGLSLVKALVEKHNGNISVKSEVGKGTEFRIQIPHISIPKNVLTALQNNNSYIQNHVERISIEFSDIYL